MSEWYDNQKNGSRPTKDVQAIRDLIAANTDSKKLRTLTVEEQKRADKLTALITDLESDKKVDNRTLKNQLTTDQYQSIVEIWDNQKELRKYFAEKPDAIKDYEQRLKNALFTHSRAERYSTTGKHKAAQILFNKADTEFERILERLEEIIAADKTLKGWFDRDTEQRTDNDVGISPDQIPRVITSRSLARRRTGLLSGLMKKRDVKIQVIKSALYDLTIEPEKTAPTKKKLDKFLQLKNNDF